MTPQYILKKSLGRMAAEWEKDHKENPSITWREPAHMLRSAISEIENLTCSHEYAEPGYDEPQKGILFANWNYFPRNIDKILERAGFTLEWSDEWSQCSGCNRAFRTSPDCMDWQPPYEMGEGEILCFKCSGKEDRDKTRAEHEAAVNGPGKFEGEPAFTSYYYEQSLDGCFDVIDFSDTGEHIEYTEITADDARIFEDLAEHVGQFICIRETEQGFVYHAIKTKDEIRSLEMEAEQAEETEEL